jgi:hypothetical protein
MKERKILHSYERKGLQFEYMFNLNFFFLKGLNK